MQDKLSPDAQAIVLLCSHLALPQEQVRAGLRPLTLREWDHLAKRIWNSELQRPGALLTMGPANVASILSISSGEEDRLRQLLSRGGQLAIELDRLAGLGIHVLTRADDAYPRRLKEMLNVAAPPVLCYAGDVTLLTNGFLAVVGSRDVDNAGKSFAEWVGQQCAAQQAVVVSGLSRGVDSLATFGAINAGGKAIAVIADSLEKVLRMRDVRKNVADGNLLVVTPQHPRTGFSIGAAMARNKYIYCLARYGLVVSASEDKGGTRTGALEVLKERWVPLFVRADTDMPSGNQLLMQEGALRFDLHLSASSGNIRSWLSERAEAWSEASPRKLAHGRTTAQNRSIIESEGKSSIGQQISDASSDMDLFQVVWPYIAKVLAREHTIGEIARSLHLEESQARAWLDYAVRLGHAEYVAATSEYVPSDSRGVHQLQLTM